MLQWPGYTPSEQQVLLKNQTPARNPVTLETFVKYVGSRVLQFLVVGLSLLWLQQEVRRFNGHLLGLRARSL